MKPKYSSNDAWSDWPSSVQKVINFRTILSHTNVKKKLEFSYWQTLYKLNSGVWNSVATNTTTVSKFVSENYQGRSQTALLISSSQPCLPFQSRWQVPSPLVKPLPCYFSCCTIVHTALSHFFSRSAYPSPYHIPFEDTSAMYCYTASSILPPVINATSETKNGLSFRYNVVYEWKKILSGVPIHDSYV